MSTTTTAAPTGAADATANVAHVGDQPQHIQRPNGSKAARALGEIRAAGGVWKQITEAMGDFVADYEGKHRLELDRAQAAFEYGPRPLIQNGVIVVEPDEIDGEPTPKAGEPFIVPSRISHLTDADWEASGNKLRLPRSPAREEVIAAILPLALELAEDRVYRLLALFLMDNADVKRLRKSGELDAELDTRADDLLGDAFADEILELAVVCGEVVDHHFRRKAADLGDRVGNALRLIGLGPKQATKNPEPPSTTPESSTPTSPSDSDEHSDGPPTTSSASPTTSSSESVSASTPSASESEQPRQTP